MTDVRLPDGTLIRNVPEGTTKQDLIGRLRRADKIDRETAIELLGIDTVDARKELDESLSTGQRFLIGTGRGFVDVIEGAKQLGMEAGEFLGMVAPEEVERFNEQAQSERDLYARGDLGAAGTAGRITGNIAATAVPAGVAAKVATSVPAGMRAAQAIQATRLSRTGAAGVAGATGGATQFVEEGDTRGQNTLIGLGTGLVAGPVIETIGRRVSRAMRGIKRGSNKAFTARFQAARKSLSGNIPDKDVDRVARSVADGLTPEQAIRKYEIERVGATPTRGRVSGDIDDLRSEVEGARFSGQLADIEQANRQAIADTAEGRVRELAGDASTEGFDAGASARGVLRGARSELKGREKAAWEEAGERLESMGDDVEITLARTGDAESPGFLDVIEQELDFFDTEQLRPVASRLKRIGVLDGNGDIVEGVTLTPRQAEATRRVIGEVFGNDRNANRVAGKLQRALEKDVTRDVGEDVFKDARSLSAERFARFDDKDSAGKVADVLQGKIPPEELVNRISSKSFSVEDTSKFFDELDRVDGTAANQLRGSVLDDLFGSLKGTTDAGEVETITARTFERKLNRLGDEKLRRIFGKDGAKGLRELAKVSKQLTGVDARVKNPGTAAEVESRLRSAFGAILDLVPGGNLIRGVRQLSQSGKASRAQQRAVERALNMELLQNDNVLQELSRPVTAGVPAAFGSGAVSANQ